MAYLQTDVELFEKLGTVKDERRHLNSPEEGGSERNERRRSRSKDRSLFLPQLFPPQTSAARPALVPHFGPRRDPPEKLARQGGTLERSERSER